MKVATLLAPRSVNLIRLRKYLNNTLHHVEKDGGAEDIQHNSIFCHAKQQCNYSESHRTVSVATTKTAKSGHCCTLASRPITRQRLKTRHHSLDMPKTHRGQIAVHHPGYTLDLGWDISQPFLLKTHMEDVGLSTLANLW